MAQRLGLEEALALARDLAQSGDLAGAAQICASILHAVPDQPRALHILAIAAVRQGYPGEAVELLRRAVRADPHFAVAFNDLGYLLAQQGMLSEAAQSYRHAIAEAPAFAGAHNNLGHVLEMAGSFEEAVACYRNAISLRPGNADVFRNLSSALRRLGRLDEAVAALRAALAIKPEFADAITQLAYQLKELCDWSQLDDLTAKLIAIVEAGSGAVNPFVFLSLETTPLQQLRCAQRWAAEQLGAPAQPAAAPKCAELITVGYLSNDFREHPVARLIAEVFDLHDRGRFRVIGYSYGRDDGSATRRALRESFDHFEDLRDCSHAESASRIRAGKVDILVDLKGYTTDARPEILALRPAPVQVSYLGYPGTMGSDAVDYIVVDPVVVPAAEQPYFTERLVHLPDCYQVNDRRRPIAPRIPARAECGLPEDGVRVLLLQLRIQDHGADVRYLDAAARAVCREACCGCSSRTRRRHGQSAARGGIETRRRGRAAGVRAVAAESGTPGALRRRRPVSRHTSLQRTYTRERCALGRLPGDHVRGPGIPGTRGGEPAAGGRAAGTGDRLPGGLRGPGVGAGARFEPLADHPRKAASQPAYDRTVR